MKATNAYIELWRHAWSRVDVYLLYTASDYSGTLHDLRATESLLFSLSKHLGMWLW